jgi:AcrR family transcriptional regulator
MSPRRYKTDRRQAAKDETRRQIVDAAVELHAEHGPRATTYAMIAKRADVAVPTVYNHFPDPAALFAACTGDVAARAPLPGPDLFNGRDSAEARIAVLVPAVFAAHRFMAPWLRRGVHEAVLIPELGKVLEGPAQKMIEFIALALAPRFGAKPPPALLALCGILLDFTTWQRLSEDGVLKDSAAVEPVTAALLAIFDNYDTPHPQHVTAKMPRSLR